MSGVFTSLESRTLSLGGLTLHYFAGGSGSPVVLVHGLGSSASLEWRFTLDALANQHQVFALDLPGFGQSDKPAVDYGLSFFQDTVRAFIAALNLPRVALMAVSFGGRVALGLALDSPAVIDKLVLVDSLGLGAPRRVLTYRLLLIHGIGELMLSSTEMALRRLSPSTVRRFWGWYVSRPHPIQEVLGDSQLADYQQMMATPAYRAAYLATLRAVASLRRLRDGVILEKRLGELSMPTLIVWGRRDHIFPAAHAEAAQTKIPQSRVVILEDSGHTPQLEEPDRFNQLVLDFLRTS